MVVANQRVNPMMSQAPENGLRSRLTANHGQTTNGHRMTIAPMTKTDQHAARQNHHPIANHRVVEKMAASQVLPKNHLVKNPGIKLVIALIVQMMTGHKSAHVHSAMTRQKAIEARTRRAVRIASHHSIKSRPLARSHPLVRAQTLATNRIKRAVQTAAKASAMTGMTADPTGAIANLPSPNRVPNLANLNPNQMRA
jgi:hypothetical protein